MEPLETELQIIRMSYRELVEEHGGNGDGLPSLKEAAAQLPHAHEKEIVAYLRDAPNYSAVGKVVGDVLDPARKVVLFPGANTDGLFIWPMELAYYVEKYHVRVPEAFAERMASLNWKPPTKSQVDFHKVYRGVAGWLP